MCQQDGDDLKEPSANLNPDVCGYSALARNINAFINEGLQLPNKIIVDLSDPKAKWHKGCQAKLAPLKLKKALKSAANKKKRKGAHSEDAPSKRICSNLHTKTQLESCLCLCCNKPGLFRAVCVKMKQPPRHKPQ